MCRGARSLEHDHFFTTANAFGSHDENGEEVDGGDFEVVDDDTVAIHPTPPSLATTVTSSSTTPWTARS